MTAALAIPLYLFGPGPTTAVASTTCTPVSYTNCVRYGYTGADQTFTVPAGVTGLDLKVWGAGGANGLEAKGGGGGFTTGTLAVTPGQTLSITVGQAGQENSTVATYGAGGPGGTPGGSLTEDVRAGGSGGGMSAVWSTSYGVGPLLIAGGGGAGAIDTDRDGGGGGGNTGAAGVNVASGGGASQVVAGAPGNNTCGEANWGGMFSGGAGGSGYKGGGGGGGGYFGGGGGDCKPSSISGLLTGAGGGGSGYKTGAGISGASSVAATDENSAGAGDPLHTSGIGDAEGNGMVVIQWFAPPPAPPLTSSGAYGLPQTATAAIPVDGTVTLLDGSSLPATTVTLVPSQGTYTIDVATGVITFTPAGGFTGTATPVTYKVAVSDLSATSTYTPTVAPQPGPTATPLTSTGVGTTPQTATVVIPGSCPGCSAMLLGPGNQPATTVTVAKQGTYTLSGTVITFTPVKGFAGVGTPAGYRIMDNQSRTADSTYTPTVTKPAPPHAVAKTSTGLGTAAQSAAVDVPDGASVTLLDNGTQVSTVTRSGEGTYGWNETAERLTFQPVAGFVGVAGSVTYRLTDSYEQHDDATYTATVTIPPPPAAPDRTTSGVGVTPQTATLPVPASGSIALVDADGNPTTSLFFEAKGTYTLTLVPAAASAAAIGGAFGAGTVPNPSQQAGSALVTFTPVLGFHGQLPPIPYQVTDAYGQTAKATYTPLVTIPGPPETPPQHTTAPADVTQTAQFAVPTGGSITLLDARRRPATLVRIPGQGTYILEPARGRISFVAVNGFTGQAKVVWYRVTDAYGQVAEATYAANVLPSTLAVTGLGIVNMILVGASMIPTGAALVALGSRRRTTAAPIAAAGQ
ncbi:glycine-rich protein [Dactylosporangium sp. NPDC049525]|uniref:glycine-rich protein n=1 Tax=Dactylosporangium sp. NPDC049525 TaxID=3154730 RepID=UPI00343521FB